ncbi:hypothetical protein D8674_033873 [Pyrus ussuriensis x Pyrus communis]|uniref:Uncharacterized protein n=1 Tax=Pyrus ussuriensis x Pyrus communis TaxID=2448454 RepID=A0A5N5HN89_9ROSA|nr:hypothetical protein D8674_033873 [Pyrus ussuriensis x Pyrus communis]
MSDEFEVGDFDLDEMLGNWGTQNGIVAEGELSRSAPSLRQPHFPPRRRRSPRKIEKLLLKRMDRGGRASQMVDLVDLEQKWFNDIVSDELESRQAIS